MNSKTIESTQKTQAQLCTECKKFFGSQAFKGLCSGCHKKTQPAAKPAQKKPEQKVKQQKKGQKYKGEDKGVQIDKNKCFFCNRKVGYLGIQCKCGYVFCNKDRMPQDHKCTYNFEAQAKDQLKKQLKKIDHAKLAKTQSQLEK